MSDKSLDPNWFNAAPGELYGDSYRFADEQEEDEEMSYDEKCYDLAKAFLADEPELDSEGRREILAQAIQNEIEQTIGYWNAHKGVPDEGSKA